MVSEAAFWSLTKRVVFEPKRLQIKFRSMMFPRIKKGSLKNILQRKQCHSLLIIRVGVVEKVQVIFRTPKQGSVLLSCLVL